MGMIAGLEVGLPSGIDDVDAAWMTAVLRVSGAIGVDATVTSVVNEPYIAGGLLSLLFRSTLESDDARAPVTVIVKFPSDIPAQRAMADAFGVYNREVVFYREIAPRSDIAMPVVHAAMTAKDLSNSCIVMEDLAHLRQPGRTEGVTWDEAVKGIQALARFHSGWHNSPELPDLMDPFISIGAPIQRGGLPSIAKNGWPGAKHHEPDVLSPDVIALGDMWVDRLDSMLDHMCTNPTLCHQDWRADNMFLGDDGGIVMIDPQIAGVANGAYDIGYFISQSMERPVRAGRERELIQHYVDAIAEHGHQLDPDQVYFDTRVAVGLCLMYGFSSYAQYDQLDEQGKEMTRKLLRRGAESIDDFDSLDAVLELPRAH
jgi:Phosphotransferase enzyme family